MSNRARRAYTRALRRRLLPDPTPMVKVGIRLDRLRSLDPEVIRMEMREVRLNYARRVALPRMTGALAGEAPPPRFEPTQRQREFLDGKVDPRRFYGGRRQR